MTPKKVESVCVPLDPDDCGSVIHGYVRYPELRRNNYQKKLWEIEYSASVSLSDCNRVIQWCLTGDPYDIEKLDRAIGALTKLRGYMVEAAAEYKKLNVKKIERNVAIDPEYKGD